MKYTEQQVMFVATAAMRAVDNGLEQEARVVLMTLGGEERLCADILRGFDAGVANEHICPQTRSTAEVVRDAMEQETESTEEDYLPGEKVAAERFEREVLENQRQQQIAKQIGDAKRAASRKPVIKDLKTVWNDGDLNK